MAKLGKKGSNSKFRAAVAGNVKQQKLQGSKYGYLNLPKNIRVFKEEPGSRVSLDILPYIVTDPKHMDKNTDLGIAVVGEQWYKKPYKIHRGIGANKESFVCLTTFGKKCPICEHRAKRVKDGDAEDDELKALKPSLRNLYVVVPLNSKDHEKKPHIWDISQYLFQDKLNEELEEDDTNAVFPDPDEGLTLKIRFSEEYFGKNKYAATSRIDFEEREKPYKEKDLKDVPNLDEILQVLTYNELEAKYFEYETEDEEEDGTSVRSMMKPKKKKEADPDEEDEDDADDSSDEDDEDEDDTSDEDEDEDTDDEDEEEEDEEDTDDDEDDDEVEEEEEEEDIPEKEKCMACKGTGKNSKGGICKPCNGTGRKQEKKSAKKEKKVDKKAGKNKCPYGHVFGKDCEEYDECDDCPKWDDCMDAKED